MDMRLVIDRFEGKYAVCELENGEFVDVPEEDIPQEAKEGDVITKTDNKYCVDKMATENKRKEIKHKMDRLFVD